MERGTYLKVISVKERLPKHPGPFTILLHDRTQVRAWWFEDNKWHQTANPNSSWYDAPFVTHWVEWEPIRDAIICSVEDLEDFYNEGQAMGYAAAKMENSFSDEIIDKAIGKDFEYVLQTKFKYLPPRGGIS